MKLAHVAIAFLAIAPSIALSQRNEPSGVRRTSAREQISRRPNTSSDTSGKPSVWAYVGGGALVGAVASGVGLAVDGSVGNAELGPIIAAFIILGGTVAGALLGLLAYHIRY